jgi:hypothetical protein
MHDEPAASALTVADTPLLLAYAVSSVPSPLGAGETGTATLSVSPIVAPVYCNAVVLSVRIGTQDGCVFATPPAASVSLADWTHDPVVVGPGSAIGLGAGTFASYAFTTDNPAAYLINYPLSFHLEGLMAPIPGDFSIPITERAGRSSDPSSFSTNQGSAPVSTIDPSFYVENFVATADGAPTVPRSQFANGATIVFSWESNGSSFALYRKDETTPFWTGTATTWTLKTGPSTDTTFILQASSTTGDLADAGNPNATRILYRSLTLTIANPDLTPTSVTASADVTVGGTLNVATIASKGPYAIQVTGNGFAVIGNAGVTGSLEVKGDSLFGDVKATTLNLREITGPEKLFILVNGAGLGVYGSANICGDLWVRGTFTPHAVTMVHTSHRGEHVSVSPPLSRRPEVHLSGTAKLVDGRVDVRFDESSGNMIARGASYQVMLTPIDECEGVRVASRSSAGFSVQELRAGRSSSSFDWFVIAPRAKSAGGGEAEELAAPELVMGPPMPGE